MKKIIYILLLVFVLSVMPFSACGGTSYGDNYGQEIHTPQKTAEYPAAIREKGAEQVKNEITDFDIFSAACVKWLGRNKTDNFYGQKAVALKNVASGFSVSFKGESLSVKIYSESGKAGNIGNGYIRVYVDGRSERVELKQNGRYYDLVLASGLDGTKIHTVKMLKAVEEDFSEIYVSGITTDGAFFTPDEESDVKIDFYGDSITAGFGILGNGGELSLSTALCDGTVTYAAEIAEYLNADYNVLCKQGIALSSACDSNKVGFYMKDVYKNYSVYDDTPWDYSSYQPDLIIINLGTNDFNSLIRPSDGKFAVTAEMVERLKIFIEEYAEMVNGLHEKCPKAKIICCLGMMGALPLYEKIESKITELKAQGGDYLYCAELYLGKLGAYGHPSVQSNQVNAEILLELISAYCGINR